MKKITFLTILTLNCIVLHGQINFTKEILPDTGNPNQIDTVLSADFDNDGDIDLVSAEEGYWYENDGNGNFTTISLETIPRKFDSITIGDLNNDGFMDIVGAMQLDAGSGQFFNNIYVYSNNQNGTFTRNNALIFDSAVNDCQSMDVGDIDSDGLLDILVSSNGGTVIFWLKQNSLGGFSKLVIPPSGATLTDTFAIKLFDYDNDNNLDFFSTKNNPATGAVRLHKNNGDGTFTVLSVGDSVLRRAKYITLGDTDNNGENEIFVSGRLEDEIRRYVYNSSTNAFTQTIVHTSNAPGAISIADINNDGLDDILMARDDNNAFFWLENNGNGTSYTNRLVDNFVADTEGSIAIIGADIDNDGDIDIIGGAKEADKLMSYKSGLITLGRKEEFQNNIEIFPNPTTDYLLIKNTNNATIIKISILDSKGRLISEIPYSTDIISLKELTSGIYFVKLYANDKSITEKIIKK